MKLAFPTKFLAIVSVALLSNIASAELQLSSPLFENGGTLPAGSKCTRDGGEMVFRHQSIGLVRLKELRVTQW